MERYIALLSIDILRIRCNTNDIEFVEKGVKTKNGRVSLYQKMLTIINIQKGYKAKLKSIITLSGSLFSRIIG